MAAIDHARRQLRLKLVLAGVPFSGKEEILREFAGRLGQARFQSTQIGESSILSAFLLIGLPGLKDWSIDLSVHTVAGSMDYNATMELLFENSDGLAFVCPIQRQDIQQIRESLQSVIFNLKRRDFDLASYPFVIHYRELDPSLRGVNLDEVESFMGITPGSLPRVLTPHGDKGNLSDSLLMVLSKVVEKQSRLIKAETEPVTT